MLSCGTGYALLKRYPFPGDDAALQLVLLSRPLLFVCLHRSYEAMLFSTPRIAFSSAFALLYIFGVRSEPSLERNPLPDYPHPGGREELFLLVGEIHHQKLLGPVENPQWLVVPERGLSAASPYLGPSAPAIVENFVEQNNKFHEIRIGLLPEGLLAPAKQVL
jgi:hypothetical protein